MIDIHLAPIVLFVYNRPEHTLKTLKALKENHLSENSRLFIYADGAKAQASLEDKLLVERVQEIIKRELWCGEIELRISEINKGCRNTIENGVTEIVNEFGRVIVIEDDIVTSPYFLTYMNDGLNKYEEEKEVMLMGGYTPPLKLKNDHDVFFLKYATPWGWATWSDRWEKYNMSDQELLSGLDRKGLNHTFNFNDSQDYVRMIQLGIDGEMEPWDVCWYATVLLNNGYGVYPNKSLVRNIGFDGSGIHCGTGYWYDIRKLNNKRVKFDDLPITENKKARDAYVNFYRSTSKIRLKDKVKFKYQLELNRFKNYISKK